MEALDWKYVLVVDNLGEYLHLTVRLLVFGIIKRRWPMQFQERYGEFLKTPFPQDASDNEQLVDILFDLRMYDDYICASIDKYLLGKDVDKESLKYDGEMEKQLIAFIKDDNNTDKDKAVANLYLSYIIKIKEMLKNLV